MAIWSAADDVREGRTVPVPRHLRDRSYRGAKRLGHGEGYRYAHDHPGGFVEQDYLGVDKTYYVPTDRGHEARIAENLARIRTRRGDERPDAESDGGNSPSPDSP
jgi:putative ATPase